MNNLKKLALFSLTGSVVFVFGCGSNSVMGTADDVKTESAKLIIFDDYPKKDSITIPVEPPIPIAQTVESVNKIPSSIPEASGGGIAEATESTATKPPPSGAQQIADQPVPLETKSTDVPATNAAVPIIAEIVKVSSAKVAVTNMPLPAESEIAVQTIPVELTDEELVRFFPQKPQLDSLCIDCIPVDPIIH